MSDFFSRFGDHYDQLRNRQAQEYNNQLNYMAQSHDFIGDRDRQFAAGMEDIRKRNERAQQLRERYGFDYSIDQYAALGNALDKGIIGDDQAYDILASQTISDNFARMGVNIDPVEVLQNLPAYNEYVLGRPQGQSARTPKDNLTAIWDSFVTAGASMRRNFLGIQLASARNGNNTELERIINERIRQEEETIEQYSDYQKRNFFVDAVKFAAQSSVYTGFVLAGGMIGGLPGAFLAGWSGATGQSYLGLTGAGVDHKIAQPISIVFGAVNAAIESSLGNAAGLIGRATGAATLQQSIARRASNYIADKLHLSGIALKMATGPVTRYVLESAGEMSEEIFQEIADIISVELAAFIQKEGVHLDHENYINDVLYAAKAGFMASLFMGLPGLAIDTVGSIRDYRSLRTDADTIQNEQLFKERQKNSPLRGSMNDEEWNGELSKIFQGRQSIRDQEEARLASENRNRRLYGALDQSGDIYRNEQKALYMEHSRHTESNGFTIGEFAAGDPHKSEKNSYAIGNYELRGDTVAVTEFRIGEKYERLLNEIFQNFANDIGKEIEYNGQRYAPAGEGQSLRFGWETEQAAQSTPQARRFNIDRQPYTAQDTQADITTKQQFAGQLRSLDTKLSDDAQINTVVDFYDTIGRKWFGMGFDSFMNRLTGGNKEGWVHQNLTDEEIARWAANNEGVLTNPEAVKRIQENLTDAQRDAARENIKGFAVPGMDGVTKAVYAAREADVSTFIHEGVHAFTLLAKKLEPALFHQMIEAAGFKQDEYNNADPANREEMIRNAMETLAYGAEAYLKEGPETVKEPALKNLYARIKEFLKDLADAVRKGEYLTPEVRALFDSLFGENTQENMKTAQERQETASAPNGTEGTGKDVQKPSVTQQEAIFETFSEEYELYSDSFNKIIKDENRSIEERSKEVVRKAEFEYTNELAKNVSIEPEETRNIPSRAWPENFPNITQLTTVSKMRAHNDYRAAKAGDMEAAARLVRDIMSGKNQQDKIRSIAEKYPDAILVAVHAEEMAGKNKIPGKISHYISEATGLEIITDIVQTNKVGHTGENAWYRLTNRAKFNGDVKPNRKYILIDDVVTGGGTFSELRRFIELNGGEVVDMLSAGAAQFSTNIALSEKTRLDIEQQFGVESLQQFLKEEGLYGGNHKALTESEARLILGAKTLDRARDRIAAARRESIIRTQQRSIQGHQGDIGSQEINSPDNINILFQAAYHGSPHRFERFDSAHMGSGEGAQAYGWGHYFASKKKVAEWYREKLSGGDDYFPNELIIDGRNLKYEEVNDPHVWRTLAEYFKHLNFNDLETVKNELLYISNLRSNLNEDEADIYFTVHYIDNDEEYILRHKKAYEIIKDAEKIELKYNEGQLYEVDIPGDEEMLDWDKPLKEQNSVIKDSLKQFLQDNQAEGILDMGENTKGQWIYEGSVRVISNNLDILLNEAVKYTSLKLNEYGIKGIRYLDGSSRGKGKGSYNYVIFDDSEIDITQTFYSESFRDAGLSDFMNSYPEVVKEASRFNSGAEMAEYYADWFSMSDEVYKKANALGYFDAIARAASKGNAEKATNAIPGISVEKATTALSAYDVEISDALEAAKLVRNDDWQGSVKLLEEKGVPRIDAETYADIAKLFGKSEMRWMEKRAVKTVNLFNKSEAEWLEKKALEEENTSKNNKIIKLGKENPAIIKFFNTIVEGSKEIYPDSENEMLRAELAGEPRTAKAFVDMINTNKGFDDFISAAYNVHRDGQIQGETEAETKQNGVIYDRAKAVFNTNNGNWKVAFENKAAGKIVNDHTKKIIRGMIRNRPLQYMEAWAIISGDDTWLPEENDIKRIKRLDTEGLVDEEYLERQSPEELERIGRRLSSDRVKKKIEDKTLLLDDPDLEEYDKQLKEDMTKAQKLIAEREKGFKEYRNYLEMAKSNAKKEQILLEQNAANTSDIGLKASKERTKELAKAHQQVRNTVAEMELFMREDLLPSQREAFFELRKQLKERERINAELKAIEEIREIKKRNIRQILRKPDLKTVSLQEAKYIEWIQAHFDSYQAVAKFIGRGAKDIRQLYNEFATNAEYRNKLKKKLPPLTYYQIERTVFKDLASREVRAYGSLDVRQRKVLYKHLVDYHGIFEELGIDILAEPRKFSKAEWDAIKTEMQDFIPADVMQKLEGLINKDENKNRLFKVEKFNIEDLQTLAGIVNRLRKEGREREAARKDAKKQLRQDGREKILKTFESNMPKNAAKAQMKGIASTRIDEERRSGWKGVWYSLHNARRFFRRLEGGKDGYLYDFITQREYDAFDQENRYVFERRKNVEKELKDAKIDLKELGRPNRFTLFNGQKVSLDEMLSFYYAQYNERALNAVIFGNFASQEERDALKAIGSQEIKEQLDFETMIALRYWNDMKKLDEFFSQEGNGKYRKLMEIIGQDYDGNYERLKEFVAREYNEELGSEQYYMPLIRQGVVAQENTEVEKALADTGLSRYINKGFTKSRMDIPPFAQQPIQTGMYMTWDRMVVKQEHLMAYDPLYREMQQIFKGPDSEILRDTLRRGHSEAAVKYVEKFISELASPPAHEDYAAMDKVNRMMRGHYPAAVLGGRIASIVKQAIESPPPFFQFVSPLQYTAAGASCLKQETRDMIKEKSMYMKTRYFDPAAAVVNEMEKMYLSGKLGKVEALFAKIESKSMYLQSWIDSVCVLPGWLAAYTKKLTELNQSNSDITVEMADAQAIRYADQIVRDCQPSSILMDQIPLLKENMHPFIKMFFQFQTPIASIFGQLFIDAPINFKQGRVLQGLWTWGIYALLAITIGAMHEEDDDDDWNPKKRGIDALVMPISMLPIFGGDAAYATENLLRTGKIQILRRSYFPVFDQVIHTANAISDEKWDKAGWEAVKGFMYYTGLPVAAFQDIEKAIETGRPQRIIGIK